MPLDHALQLQVYADAGRREGLDVRAAYVHDLKAASREPIAVAADDIGRAEEVVAEAADADPRRATTRRTPARVPRAARCAPSAGTRSVVSAASDVEDLQDLVAVVVDHLDGDLARSPAGRTAATRCRRGSPRRPRRCPPSAPSSAACTGPGRP